MGECWWRMGREETNRRQTKILLQTFAFTIYYVKIRKKISEKFGLFDYKT